MEINLKNTDELNAVLKIKINKEDYEPKVEKKLKEYRKKANLNGFRPGMAPMGLIKKMYGKHILADEVNTIFSESMFNYIKENKLDILGEPIPSETEKTLIDFDNDTDFEFAVDLGFAPKIEFDEEIIKDIKKYKIKVDDDLINTQIKNLQNRAGGYQEIEKSEEKSSLYCLAEELDEQNNVKEDGIRKEEASILIKMIKDEEIKKQMIDKKVGDEIIIDIKKAFPNETEISSLLNVEKEKLPELGNNFKFSITKINNFVPAEINQEFFDTAFGKDVVKNEEEMKEKIKSQYEKNFTLEEDYKLLVDIKDKLTQEVKFDIPAEFLKRWLKLSKSEKKLTDEIIERDFPQFAEDLSWKLIKDYLVEKNEIKVEKADLLTVVKDIMNIEFAQYGLDISNFSEEQQNAFAEERLNSKDNPNLKTQYFEKASEDKLIEKLQEKFNFKVKEISLDEFKTFFEKN